jgi:hypothetical protein
MEAMKTAMMLPIPHNHSRLMTNAAIAKPLNGRAEDWKG